VEEEKGKEPLWWYKRKTLSPRTSRTNKAHL
jgi:hypothetical protein